MGNQQTKSEYWSQNHNTHSVNARTVKGIGLIHSQGNPSGTVESIEVEEPTSGVHNFSTLAQKSYFAPDSNPINVNGLNNSRENSFGSVEAIEVKTTTSGVPNSSQLAKKRHLAPNSKPKYGNGLINSQGNPSQTVASIEVKESQSKFHNSSHLTNKSNFSPDSNPKYGNGLIKSQRETSGTLESIGVKNPTSEVHSHFAPDSNLKYENGLNNSRGNQFKTVEPIEVEKTTSEVHDFRQLAKKSHLAPDSYSKYGNDLFHSQGNPHETVELIEVKETTSEVNKKSQIDPDLYPRIDKNQKQQTNSIMSELNVLTDMQEICFNLSSIEKRVKNIQFSTSQQNILTELLGTAQDFMKLINHSLESHHRSSTPNSVGSVHQQNTNISEALGNISVISAEDAKFISQRDTSVLSGILNEYTGKEGNPEEADSEMNEIITKSEVCDSSTFERTKVRNESIAIIRRSRPRQHKAFLQMRKIRSYMQELRIDQIENEIAVIGKLTEFRSFLSNHSENSSKRIRKIAREVLLNIENVLSKLSMIRMQKEIILKGTYEEVHSNIERLEVNVKLCSTKNSGLCEMISLNSSLFEKYLPVNELIEQSDREDLIKMVELISESFRKKVSMTKITETLQSEIIPPIANKITIGDNRVESKLQQIENRQDEMKSQIESKGTTDKDTECDVDQVAQFYSIRKKIPAVSKMPIKKLDREVCILMTETEGSGITYHFTIRNDIQTDHPKQLLTFEEPNLSENVLDGVEKKVDAAMAKVKFYLKYDSTEECGLLKKDISLQYQGLNGLEFDMEEKNNRRCDINGKILKLLKDMDQHIMALAGIKHVENGLKYFGKRIEKYDEIHINSLKIWLNDLRRRIPQISSQSSECRRRLRQCDDIIQSYLDEIDGKTKYYYFSSIV